MVVTQKKLLNVGDDVGAWFTAEIPLWEHPYEGEKYSTDNTTWAVASPTYAIDGMVIQATSPQELVERVRTIERLIAIVLERQGIIPVEGKVAGIQVDGEVRVVPEPKLDPSLVTMSTSTLEMAKLQGYTGDACQNCGSMKMIRTGKCLLCTECYAAPQECG